MIDLRKYLTDENDISFMQELYEIVSGQSDVKLRYKSWGFLLEPLGTKIEIWHEGECVAKFESLDDMLLNYLLDGKPFIEQVEYIDYED